MKPTHLLYHDHNRLPARVIGRALSRNSHPITATKLTAQASAVSRVALHDAGVIVALFSPSALSHRAFRRVIAYARRYQIPVIAVVVEPLPNLAVLDGMPHVDAADLRDAMPKIIQKLNIYRQPSLRSWVPPRQKNVNRQVIAALGAIAALLIVAGIILWLTADQLRVQDVNLLPTAAELEPLRALTVVPTRIADGSLRTNSVENDVQPFDDLDFGSDADLFAEFFADPLDGAAPLEIIVEDFSEGAISAYEWDFDGDGEVDSIDPNPPAYTYEEPGDYELTLTIFDAAGNNDSYTEIIFVDGESELNDDPIDTEDTEIEAFFLPDRFFGEAPLAVIFTDQSFGDGIVSYAWDFNGDGETDSLYQRPKPYVYTLAGEYDATLTITSENGDEYSYTETISVEAAEAPFPFFSADPIFGEAPLTVTLLNSSEGAITRYGWDFDSDGLIDSTDPNPAPLTFNEPGVYEITLNLIGPGGRESDTIDVEVDPVEPPFVFFDADPIFGTAPLTVNFLDFSDGQITDYAWDLDGDGTIDSRDRNPTFTYNQPGIYPVRLTVTGPGGSDSDVLDVEVEPVEPPFAFLDADTYFGVAPLEVKFFDFSDGVITSYEWDFDGDGVIDSTEQNPTFTYTEAGIYAVNLTVTGPGGRDQDGLDIEVEGMSPPLADFAADMVFGTAPLVVTFANFSEGQITTYEWDFDGDGEIDSTLAEPDPYTYEQPGIYTASLTVTGAGGNDILSEDIEVEAVEDTDLLVDDLAETPPDDATPPTLTLVAISVEPVAAGDIIVYTATLENQSDDWIDDVQLIASVPANTTYRDGSTRLNGETVTDIISGSILVGSVDGGERVTLTFEVTVNDLLPEETATINAQVMAAYGEGQTVRSDDPKTVDTVGDLTLVQIQPRQATATVIANVTTTASPTDTPTVAPSIVATEHATANVTATVTVTPSITASIAVTATPSATLPLGSPTMTATVAPSITVQPSAIPSITDTPPPTHTPSATVTSIPTNTPLPTHTPTLTPSPTITPSATATTRPPTATPETVP